jgi:hypothetical protein
MRALPSWASIDAGFQAMIDIRADQAFLAA